MYTLTRQVTFLVYGVCLLVLGLKAQCPDGCKCTGDKINCSVPKELFNLYGCDLKKLDTYTSENINTVTQLCLTQNRLDSIDSKLFQPMSNLLNLDLTSNQISTISGEAFHSLTELQRLVLINNNLNSIGDIFNKNTKLTFLNLASNRITEIRDKDFENLSKLKYLDLSSNQIATIDPKAFEPLKSLRCLILQSNRITYLNILSFTLKSLRLADFTSNNLNRVPRGLPKTITDLRFGKNNITRIGKNDLKHISALQLLTFNDNQISSIHENAFNGLDNVKEIWLNSNKLYTMPTKLPKNLLKLAINSNLISKIEKHTFQKSLHIKELILETNNITEIASNAFSKLSKLQHLNLQSNQLHTLTTGIFKDLTNLVRLRLANNPITSIQRKSFKSLNSLQALDISYGELEQANIQMDIFQEMPNLQEFNLMNSPGLCKSLLNRVRNGEIGIAKSVQKIDFRYNNLLNLPENIPRIFPKLTTFLLNNNAWYCDSKLLWLKRWLAASDITFYEIKTPACCKPSNLKGKPLRDVTDSEFLRSPAARNGIDESQLQSARSSRIQVGTNVSIIDSLSKRKRRRSKRRQSRRNKRKSRRQSQRTSYNGQQ